MKHLNDNKMEIHRDEESSRLAELYGALVSESISLDCNSLITCLDGVLKSFSDYHKLIEKVAEKRVHDIWHYPIKESVKFS